MTELDHRIADVAARQRGLVTIADVERRQLLTTRAAAGRLIRAERGVYAINGLPPDDDRALLATRLTTRGRFGVSHLAAARRLGIPGYSTAPLEVSVDRGVRLRRPGLRVHESSDLDRCRIIEIDGVPVTDPARTLLDLARFIGPMRLLRNIEWCRRRGLVGWSDLITTLLAHARRGRPGIRRFREVLAANSHREEVTDADLEVLVLALLREHGLPEPVLHHEVWDGHRFVAEVDLAYPERMIAMECDGDVHLEEEVRERDLPRQNDLVLLGWMVLRFTPQRYRLHPTGIVAEVRDAHRTRSIRTGDMPSSRR
jgi:very-short-patch-repair endonuclease